jgi:hypothetical protein
MVQSVASEPLQLRRSTPVDAPPALQNTPDKKAATTPVVPSHKGAGSSVQPPGGATVAPRPLDEAGITINRLETVDPDAIGLIGGGQGGFPKTLWRGAPWSVVSGLMPRMPAGIASPVLRDMARRLLISQSSVPASKPLKASFIAIRIDRLLAMGDIGNALALLRITPDERRDEALARTRIEALFF